MLIVRASGRCIFHKRPNRSFTRRTSAKRGFSEHDTEKNGGSCHALEHHSQHRKYGTNIDQLCRARGESRARSA